MGGREWVGGWVGGWEETYCRRGLGGEAGCFEVLYKTWISRIIRS